MSGPARPGWLTAAAPVIIGALAAAHVGLLVLKAEGPASAFLVGLLVASAFPYLLCLVNVLKWSNRAVPLLVGTLALVLFDGWMYWSVFIAPRGSAAAIGLVFAPVWKIFIVLPLGVLAGLAIERAARRRAP